MHDGSLMPEMSDRLIKLLALHLHMENETLRGRRGNDERARRAVFNDGEVMDWLDRMDKASLITNTGHINAKV